MNRVKYLYLLNGERSGVFYWKVGTTSLADPLKLSNKHYLECYRNEALEASAARDVCGAILLNVNSLVKSCEKDGFVLAKSGDGISYDLPLKVMENIFDFWLKIYRNQQIWTKCIGLLKCSSRNSLSTTFIQRGLIGVSAKHALEVETLLSYRPCKTLLVSPLTNPPPMW